MAEVPTFKVIEGRSEEFVDGEKLVTMNKGQEISEAEWGILQDLADGKSLEEYT